jgi:hypothetical protein
VVGGSSFSGAPLATAEIFNPDDQTWSEVNPLSQARSGHQAILLNDGQVLVVGGTGASSFPLAAAEVFNPDDGTWSGGGSLATARTLFTATRLNDGRVLVAGGWGVLGALASAEIYQPASRNWLPAAGPLTTERSAHTASLLADGRVLVAGGDDTTGWSPLASAEIFNPVSCTWSLAAGSLKTARYYHTAATLPDGRVLVMEGVSADGNVLTNAELYLPATQTWADAGSLSAYREGFTATTLTDGQVLVAGGFNTNPFPSQCEIYSPPKAIISGSILLLLME